MFEFIAEVRTPLVITRVEQKNSKLLPAGALGPDRGVLLLVPE